MTSFFRLPSILSFVFILFITAASAQSVSGIVADRLGKTPIPYATVQLGPYDGVITNEEGRFSINTAGFAKTDSLVFSSMGYQRKSIAIKDFEGPTVYLSQSLDQLDVVYLLDKNMSPEAIMQKVNENIATNYDNAYAHFTVFERRGNSTRLKDIELEIEKADFVEEAALKAFNRTIDSLGRASKNRTSSSYRDVLAEYYLGENDSLKAIVKKATDLINKEMSTSADFLQEKIMALLADKIKSANTFRVRSGILPVADSMDLAEDLLKSDEPDSLLSKNKSMAMQRTLKENGFGKDSELDFVTNPKDYDYAIDEIAAFNGEVIYVLSFKPGRRKAKFVGKLFISAQSFAVLKANYKLAQGEHGEKLNLKFLLGIKYLEKAIDGSVIYQKNEAGKYFPRYIKRAGAMYMYFNRSFTFIENNDNKDERIKLKFELKIETDVTESNEWLFVSSEPISPETFSSLSENKGVPLESISEYDPELWKDYNIIEPGKAMKEYEY